MSQTFVTLLKLNEKAKQKDCLKKKSANYKGLLVLDIKQGSKPSNGECFSRVQIYSKLYFL